MILVLVLVLLLIITIAAACYRPPHAVGPPGKAGLAGDVGPQGPQGFPGPTGLTGNFYSVSPPLYGFRGPTGPSGTQLVPGPAGPRGVTGPAGPPTGATGFPGLRGPSYANGATGPTGAVGPTGAIGPTGPPTPGPFLFSVVHFTSTITPPPSSIAVSEVLMSTVISTNTIPSSEFTYTPSTGRITFLQAGRSYLIRVGFAGYLSGLATATWRPSTIMLLDFPATLPITLWPAAYTPTDATVSVGSTVVYTTQTVPVNFDPQIAVNMSDTTGSSLQITMLSITIERVSP